MGVVDDVKSRLDIIDFISGYVPSLKKAGRTYKGNCPFHTEKTPSFVVFPETQTWHCFGACGTGGDIFGFLMRQEGYEFPEALRVLAEKAGVPLQEQSSENIAADKARQKLLDAVAAAATYFNEQFNAAPPTAFIKEYIAKRGLSPQTIQKFQLGYAPNQWEGLKLHLLQKGYSETELVSAGLLVTRDDGSPGYDRFRDRFVIPIRDIQGRVIGFGARALHDNQVPKYLNSPQSALFDKSGLLYALDVAKGAIRDSGQAVIVEGYMDVLQAHEHGYANVVAQMGTALTEQQLRLLKRYANKFVLALDADSAGSAATLRGINTARETLNKKNVPVATAGGLQYEQRAEVDIRVVSLPPGKDPDDVIRESEDAWPKTIEQAQPLVDYYIRAVTANLDMQSAQGKAEAVRLVMPVLQELGNKIEQDYYLQVLGSFVKIDERTLRAELQRTPGRLQSNRQVRPYTQPVAPLKTETPARTQNRATALSSSEETCLSMLIGQPGVLELVNRQLYKHRADVLAVEDFLKIENGTIFLTIKRWGETETPTIDTLLELVDTHLEGHLAALVAMWHQKPPPPAEYVERELPKIIVRMRRQRLERQIKELNLLQIEALESGNREAVIDCQNMVSDAKTKRKLLDESLDALSIMGRRRIEEKFSQ